MSVKKISLQTKSFIESLKELKASGAIRYYKEVGDKIGLNEANMSLILGEHRNISEDQYNKFRKDFPLKISTQSNAVRIDLNEQNVMWVPFVSQYAYAGYMSGYADQEYLRELPKEPFIVDKEYKGNYMCFEVRGDSMDDDSRRSICEGDKLLCREIGRQHWNSKLHIEKYTFVIGMKKDGLVCKKIIKHDVQKGELTLHSLNPLYEDYKVNLDEVAILFNVVEIKRKP